MLIILNIANLNQGVLFHFDCTLFPALPLLDIRKVQ